MIQYNRILSTDLYKAYYMGKTWLYEEDNTYGIIISGSLGWPGFNNTQWRVAWKDCL